MHLVIFESPRWADLAPLTLTRPAMFLRCGVTTLLEKQIRAVRPSRVTLWVRDELAAVTRRDAAALIDVPFAVNEPLNDDPALLIDGAALIVAPLAAANEPWTMLDDANEILASHITEPGLMAGDALNQTDRWREIAGTRRESLLKRPRHWGDLVDWNTAALLADAVEWPASEPPTVACIQPADVRIRPGVSLSPGVVLDASKGPILLDRDCSIGANSVIEGPCYIGQSTRITPLSHIRGGTSIGPVCRVGGEVSGSIFQGYSNKSHDGFFGDSFVGQWVNCGAGTTTSNLKSTYGHVSLMLGRRKITTSRTTLGAAIGDHVKLATDTRLATGSYVGVGSVISVSNRLPAFNPSFRFVSDESDEPLDPAKAQEIASRMMARRERAFDAIDQAVLAYAKTTARSIEFEYRK